MKAKSLSRNQLKLFRNQGVVFGGSHREGNPTTARPFSKKCEIHVVLKSRYATGKASFLNRENRSEIKSILERYAKRFYIKVSRNVNVGNHIHLLIRAPTAQMQRRFLRSITSMIARHVTGAKKGSPSKFKEFWDSRPFTRLVSWGRDHESILHYLSLNSLEAIGFTKQTAKAYLNSISTG